MQIVIDISEEEYIKICNEPCTKLGWAVAHGTILPKGHGRLIDEDTVIAALSSIHSRSNSLYLNTITHVIKGAPDVIPADESEAQKDEKDL